MKSVSKYKANQTVPKTPVGVRQIPKPVIPVQAPIVHVQPPPVVQSPQAMKPIAKPVAPISQPIVAPKKEIKLPDATSTQLIELTNNYRTQSRLPSYTFNPVLSQSAQKRAEFIAQNQDKWSHDGWLEEIKKSGYQGALNSQGVIRVGENLAKDFKSIPEALKAWQKSPTHNANLINANFRDMGIGWAQYKDKKGRTQTVFVQHFGVPK